MLVGVSGLALMMKSTLNLDMASQDSTLPGNLPDVPAFANIRVMSEQLFFDSLTMAAAAFCSSAVEVASDALLPDTGS